MPRALAAALAILLFVAPGVGALVPAVDDVLGNVFGRVADFGVLALGAGEPVRFRASILESRCDQLHLEVEPTGLVVPATAASGEGPLVRVRAGATGPIAYGSATAAAFVPPVQDDEGRVRATALASDAFVLEHASLYCEPWWYGTVEVRGWGTALLCLDDARLCADPLAPLR